MRVVGIIGKFLIGAGIVLLLFVAYLVWGTALQQSHTQNVLRTTLEHKAQSTQVRDALAQDRHQGQASQRPPQSWPRPPAEPR